MAETQMLIDPSGRPCLVPEHAVADRLKNGWKVPPKPPKKRTKSPKKVDGGANGS